MSKDSDNIKPRSLLGIILIGLAVLLFFHNIGLRFLGHLFANWPVALMLIGGGLVYMESRHKNLNSQSRGILPYVLIALGGIFFLAQRGILGLSLGSIGLPLVLLIAGLFILRRRDNPLGRLRDVSDGKELMNTDAQTTDSAEGSTGTFETKIDIFTLLGGGHFNTRSQKLKGGSVVCILGGAEIDIRDADCEGDTIEIDILAFMGGAEIKIPPHWQVTVKVLPLMGGVSNKTTCLADKMRVPPKHLIITGTALMGGVEVRN